MISYWERESFLNYDFIIVGSGIVGLSTAIALKEAHSKSSIVVLERGLFPSGASTKNAGFACIGSPTELLEDLETLSDQEVVQLVEQRFSGLQLLRKRLGDKAIDYKALGSYELLGKDELGCLNELPRLNELLNPLLGGDAFSEASEQIDEFGFAKNEVKGIVDNHFEGQIDTGKMMRSLASYARELGVEILTGAKVTKIQTDNTSAIAYVWHEQMQEAVAFRGNQIAVCTNAFAKQLIPDLDLKPGRGQILVTQPIENLPFKGIFHFDKGYYYFRNHRNRVIFGGGRNKDFAGETSDRFAYNSQIQNELEQRLKHVILPNIPHKIEMRWTGIMGFGRDKKPVVKQVGERIFAGVKLGGMGIAIGSGLGLEIAEQMLI